MASRAYTGHGQFSDTTSELNRTDFIVRQVLNRMATATLVLVKAVGTGTVDIQPMVAQLDGAGNAVEHGTIHNVPFFMPRAGASAIVMTPAVGDIGLAVFCHNDISSVKKNKAPSNPGSRRRFDWADALYLGGFLGATPTQFVKLDADGITITSASGKPVNVNGMTVDSDGNVTIPGNLSVTGTSDFAGDDFATHKHSGVQTGSGQSGPPVSA